MNRDDVRKLIGGYATGTLTEAEREMLFAAALEDQELFDELAGEQAFKELLDTPGARERLLTAVAPAPEPRRQSWWAWGAVAAAAAAGLVLFIATRAPTETAIEIATVTQETATRQEPAAPPAPQAAPEARLKTKKEAFAEQVGQQGQQGNAAPAAFGPAPPVATPAAPAPEERQRATADQAAAVAVSPEATLLKTESAQPAPATIDQLKQLPVPGVGALGAAKGGGGGAGKRIALADAEGNRGTITGAVSDPAGGVIAGAPIEARNVDTGALYTAASQATGNFTLPQLPAGNYEMTVAVAGFKRFERQNITLQGTQVLRLDVPLEVGSTAETVTSIAPSALLAGKAGKGKAATPFALTYQRAADSLRITPAAPGFLLVTAAGQTLFPQNAVLAGSNVIVPLPAGTGDVTIVFAASAAAPATQAVRRDGATGTVAEPNPSANTRLAIIVPALR